MRFTIEGLGLDVEEAANAADGILICKGRMPDIILIDWHMPGSQTLETLVSIRSLPGGKTVKLLYVTTNNDPVEIGRAIAAGVHGYMLKPFRRVTLEAKIAEFLAKAQTPVEVQAPAPRLRKTASVL